MKVKALVIIGIVAFVGIIIAIKLMPKKAFNAASPVVVTEPKPATIAPPEVADATSGVTTKVNQLKNFCIKNKMDSGIGYFINMGLPSNTYRFFIIDLKTGAILAKNLVAHGSGSGTKAIPTKFSNIDNSLCTSLGKFRIGERYFGKFGLSYKLYGYDSTNTNAYKRAVVMHGYSCVPDKEIEKPLCLSWGCPMVSNAFMKVLDAQIKGRKKPIALWIYN
jgi:hypothetical protein